MLLTAESFPSAPRCFSFTDPETKQALSEAAQQVSCPDRSESRTPGHLLSCPGRGESRAPGLLFRFSYRIHGMKHKNVKLSSDSEFPDNSKGT